MRVHVLTTVILTFADCLLYSDSQETENGLRQYLSPNPTLSSSPVKAVANQTSLNQTTNGNSSAPEETVLYLSPFKTVRRHRSLYAGANHTLPLEVATRRYSPTEGLSDPTEGRPNNSTRIEAPQNFSSPVSKITWHYRDGNAETHNSMPISTVSQSSLPISRATSSFLSSPRTTHFSLPVSSATKRSTLHSYASPIDSGATYLFSSDSSSSHDSGTDSRKTFSSPPNFGAMHYPVPTFRTTNLSMPTFRTRYYFTSTFPARDHSVPDSLSNQSSFVPDSKNYSSSFSILSGNPRSTLIKRNSFNVDQDESSHSSNITSSNFLLGKAARRSLPPSFGSSHFPPTKVLWNTRTVSLNSQPNPSSSIFDYHPLSHSPSIPEAPISTTTDTIIRVLDSDNPVSSVNTNNETPRLKTHEEKATTIVTDALGRNEITSAEEITALADATPWDEKVKTTANHAIDYFLNPGDLANDFSEDFTIALTNANKFSDAGTYDEERDGGGLYFDSSMVKDNTIITDNTDLLEKDLRVQDLLEEDDFFEIDFPDWEEDYPTDVDDSVVLTKNSIDITRIFPKGMAPWAKLPVGINDAVIPMKDAIPFTRLRGIPEYIAVPTSNAIIGNVPTDDATKFSPKMFVRKSGTPLANNDKYLAFTTVAKNDMAIGDQVTSEVNDIPTIRNSETPIQQIILTKFKPEINLPEKEDIATGNAYIGFLESSNTADKNVVDMTQLWGDNSITENYTILPEINATISTVRIPNLTNVPTRPPMPDAAVSKVNTADPLLNNLLVTPMKETLIKEHYTTTNTQDDSSMDKGQQILSDGVISRSSTPREDTTGTIYTLPRMDETFADFPDWEEDYPTDVDDSVVLTKNSIDITRIFPKGMAPWAKLPVGINDAVIPMKDAIPFTRLRGIPEYIAVPTSNAIIGNVPTDDATKFSPKMFVRKSGTPLANNDKYLAFTTVAKNDMAIGDQVTSEVNDIPTIRNSETPIQQIILTKFKPEINLPEKEDIATGNAYIGFLESSNTADKNVVDMTQLWGDNSITENYTILPEINATISTVRIPNLTNVPTRPPMPDAAVSKVNTADPLLNNLLVTPMKETLIKEHYTTTNTQDDSSMDKGQQILSDGVISRSSTPREDTTGTIYTLPRMDETFADGDTTFESNVIPSSKANDIMEADKVILTEENTPKEKILKMVILDDNDRNSAKDNSFMPQVHTAEHLVDRIKYVTNATQSDPKIAKSTTPVLSSTSDKTVTSSRKVHDIIPFMEENPESEIKAPIFLFGNDPYRDMTSKSIGGDRTSNQAKTSREDDATTENKLIPILEYYDGSEKGIMSNIIPSSFAFGSNNGALDVDNSDTTGFYVFQNEYDMTFSHLGDKVTIPEGSHSYVAQALDSKGNPTPLLYEMTNRENSKNSKSFENEMIPYVERTTTIQGDNLQREESISNDNLFINFLPIDDNILGTLVPDDSIFPETDGISPITNIFTSPPNLNTLEAPAVSYVTKSLPETTAPDLKEIISLGQQSTTVSDATSFLPKISYLGEKRTIHKGTTPNLVSSFTPVYAISSISNSDDPANNPITLEDEGISVTKNTPSSFNNKLFLGIRAITQATHLKPQGNEDNSTVDDITNSQKDTPTDSGPISHTDDETEFVRSPNTSPDISFIKKATHVEDKTSALSTENSKSKNDFTNLNANASPSMRDKDVLTTANASKILKYDSVTEKVQGPFFIKSAWTDTINNKSVSLKSLAITPKRHIVEAETLLPTNMTVSMVQASYNSPTSAIILVPGNSTGGNDTSSLLSDHTITPSDRVLPTSATTSSIGDVRNTDEISKYELESSVEKNKTIEPETLPLTERPTTVEANDAILPIKNVTENVDQMTTPLHSNILKDYGSVSEDSRTVLKTDDTDPIMGITALTYGPDGFESPAPNYLSSTIIPDDAVVTENHHTMFIGEDNSDTEADNRNLIDTEKLQVVNPRTTDDSIFTHTESFTPASREMVAIATNDMDFLPEISNPKVKITLHSSVPDTVLNTRPHIIDRTDSSRKDKLPLIKNDTSIAYDTVRLPADTATTTADPKTQEDETNTAGPELKNFKLGVDPVISFTDFVIDELPYEREEVLRDPMARGVITRIDRATSIVANGTTLPGKDNNAKEQFIIPGGTDIALFKGDVPLVTSEIFSQLPDIITSGDQSSVFIEEESLTDPSMTVVSKKSEPLVENIKTLFINKGSNPEEQIFKTQRDHYTLPLETIILPADLPTYRFSPTSSEHSLFTMGATNSMLVKDTPISNHGQRDNSERLVFETIPTEKSSYMGVENVTTQAEGNPPYDTAYKDFVLGKDVNRTGVSTTNSLLIPTDIKMAVDRKSTALRGERTDIGSNSTNNSTDQTNSKILITRTLVMATPRVQEIAFVEKKNGEAGKVVAFFLPNMRSLENTGSYDALPDTNNALPVGDISSFTTDSTDSNASSTTPSHKIHISSKNATGPIDHIATEPAPSTPDGIKAHTKDRTGVAEITDQQNHILPVTSTSIPSTEGISYVDDGTEIPTHWTTAATVPNAYTAYTEAGNNLAISEPNHSLTTGYDRELYKILTRRNSKHESEEREEREGDKSILEVTNITPFFSHDSISQRHKLVPKDILINSDEDTTFILDPNEFLTYGKYSSAKVTNSPPETAASELEEIVILEKDGLTDTDTVFLLPDISYPERKRNGLKDDPITPERAKTPITTKTEAFASKDRGSFENKIASGEDPNEVSGAEIKKTQEAEASPVTYFITPKADSYYVGANTEHLIDVTATSAFLPTKRSSLAKPKATTLYARYIKSKNDPIVSEADSTFVSKDDTTSLIDDPLNFNSYATAGIPPETLHLKETSLDDVYITIPETSRPVSEKSLSVNGSPTPGWNVINAHSDPQALQLESTFPPTDFTLLSRNLAYTYPDAVDTVKLDPATETTTSGEKYLSPKNAIFGAVTNNLKDDTNFMIGTTTNDIPVEKITSDNLEAAFQTEEVDPITGDDATREGEKILYSTYSLPFMSDNNILEGKKSDPEEDFIFLETKNNHVITDGVNPPPQITTNRETKSDDYISPEDEKPFTGGDSAIQTAADSVKTMAITADTIPGAMIKMTTEFKEMTNAEQNYSEAAGNMTFLPYIAYLSIKRKAQKDNEVGLDMLSPLALEDAKPPVAGISIATSLEVKDNSTLISGNHATNTAAGAKSPEKENKTAIVEMTNYQNNISPVTSITTLPDVRMPYANKGNKYITDLAAKEVIPLIEKNPAILTKDTTFPSEYIQPNDESTASEVGTPLSTRGGSLTALPNPTPWHHAPFDGTPVPSKALGPRTDNSFPNDAAILNQPLPEVEPNIPALPLAATLLPDDSKTSIIKVIYTRHVAATANKKGTPTAMVPDTLIPSTSGPGTEVRDIINPSSYQPDFIKKESAFMKVNEIPFVKEISAERKGVSLTEENTSNNDLMTLALDNNVTAYVTEEYIIAPPTPIIISMPTLTYEPSELGTYASYNKADSSYSAEIVTANPMQTNSTETSHTVILKYEPPDSEIHTTMLKSVAPRTMAHSNPDESKKMPSKFLKETAVEKDNKVVEDATTFMPETSNPRKKRTDFSNVLDPDTGFPMEKSRTFIMDNFGSAGEPGPIKNKEVLDINVEAEIFKPEKTTSVTAVETQYVKDDFKTIGSEMSTSQYSTIPSALFMFPEADRISHMDENMEMVTDVANMPAAEKITSVGALPAEGSETPLPRAVVTMSPDNNLLLTHENPSFIPDAKTNSAAISLQEKNEALSDDSFIVSREKETVVEQMKNSIEDDITGVTLLNNNANPIASEDNIIRVEDSLLYDNDLIGRDKYNSENNDIILESNTSDLIKVSNSCLSNRNGLDTIACKDLITFMEKNGEDKFYAKNHPGDKAEVPMEAKTVTDVITEGIKTTNQEITAVEEGNRVAVKVTSFESDMLLSETTANTHKDNDITSDRDSTFTATDTSSLVTGSTNLAENITSLENQETSVIRDTGLSSYDTVNPRVEPKIIATDAISQKREKNQMAENTNLENDVIPTPSFISLKIEDIEPVTELGTSATTPEEATTSMFSASALFPEHIKPENDHPTVSRANSPEATGGDTTLLKDATVDDNQETLPSKETSLNDTNMAVSEASRSVSKKPLPVNGAPLSGWNVVIVQSDPQALQPESELRPVDSTHFPRIPVYTAPDIVDTVIEDPVTETATPGKKYPSLNRSISADATINSREDTDFLTEATRYEDDIPVEEIISDVQEVAFDREEKNAITRDDVTQEEENTLYPTEFSSFISSSNILKDNVLAPEDYFIFPKRKDVSPISEVNEITADLSKFVAQPISPQNNIPVMTSFSVPEADRISFGNQVSETLSYSDLTGDMSSIAQTNPTKPKVLTPLPNRPADIFSAPGGNRISFENQDSDLTGDMSSVAQANPTMTRVLTPPLPNRPTDAISVPGGEKISSGNQDSETLSYSDLIDMSSIAQAKPTKPKVLTPLPNRSANAFSAPGGDRISFENQDSETLSYSDLIDMSSIAQANPTMTRGLTPSLPNRPADAFSVPEADRISFGNQNSESLSYSDLTGDMSSTAQANPTMTRGLTPSLPNRPADAFSVPGADRISLGNQNSESLSYSDLTSDMSSTAQANPTMTRELTPSLPNRPADAFSVPGADRISLGNQNSESLSYSDLTSDMSSTAQANPTMTRGLTPSLPNRPADAFSVPGADRISLGNQNSESLSYSDLTSDMSSTAQANPTMTRELTPSLPNRPADAFSVPGADRISLGNQNSESLSYSDLTGDMSSTAQANPTMTRGLTPSLPKIPGNGFFISGNGITKSNKDTTLSVETINIPEVEFISRKSQDTHMAKDDSLADLKMAKSYLLNSMTDHSAPMNNLGILEQSITSTPTYLHAFPLDASKENIISSVDSIYTEYNPSITREDTTSKMLYDAINTSPENPSLEKNLPVTSAAPVVAEDPPPKIYSPTPTTNITRNITEATVSSVADNIIPKVQIPITSEGGHLTSVDNSVTESDFLTTAVNFISTFGNFISSVTDRLTLLKEIPTSEFNTKIQCIKTPTDDVAKCISSLTNTSVISTDVIPLPEKKVIPHVTESISSTDNDAFLINDYATDPENTVSDFIVYDLEEWEITEFDRTIPSEEDDSNTMAFIPKDNIMKEKDTLIMFDLSSSEEEDTTTSETTNSIVEDTLDVNGFWIEGNPDDELNATALILDASKNKDYSVPLASEAKNTGEHKNTMKAFLTKLVGRPNESVTNAADSLPGSLTEERYTDPTKDSTPETDVTNLEEDDSKDIL
ncbi:calcium-binding and spermatid-specific protein 1 [Sminthopsis crassicaudata]|uniref:calcium-binding and spermatid-specific protein 1 n=1 Tax=Sminthopsis crassicaudata TaxID=9301 RepID=UPI003D693718